AGAATEVPAQQRGAQQQEAQCDLKTSHFAVSRAVLYIQNASSAEDSTKKQQALDGAHRSLIEALEQGQAENAAVWYFLGVYYTLLGDGLGADTSFDKVEAMLPGCAADVLQNRQIAWATVANQGIEAMRSNDYAKAKESFGIANRVYDRDPTASFYLATVFATEDEADSALHYFKLAARTAAGDTAQKEIHEKSTQNVARIYQVLEQWDSAQVYFQAYLELQSDDLEAQTGLATAYMAGGDTANAVRIYDALLAQAQNLDALDVFRIGVALFRAERPERAAQAFEAGLQKIPHYRNGLFNLTNAYFSLAQATQKPDSVKYWAGKMLPAAQRLASVDPLNRQVLRLTAAAHQFVGNNDSTDAMLKKVNEMKYEVEVQAAQATSNGYEVHGTITAIQPPAVQVTRDSIARDSTQLETLKQATVPAAQRAQLQRRQATLQRRVERLRASLQRLMGSVSVPAITFEFLSADGTVVATETVAAQAIEPGGVKSFQLTPAGPGVVAWRYKGS
ncbi:MAG: tetratricopeptide repeat protein, partial [Gemmatimonadetes bacterium]|nr:tetratricopeptide repeat protein [Gemmatimonadota bacterium]